VTCSTYDRRCRVNTRRLQTHVAVTLLYTVVLFLKLYTSTLGSFSKDNMFQSLLRDAHGLMLKL